VWRLVLLAGASLCACQFDQSGVTFAYDASASDGIDAISPGDGAGGGDAAVPVDASLEPCVDSDNDTFLIVNIAGANCPGPLDCDDTDPNAYPGQESYYDQERASGGFDYNCDGSETLIDSREGSDCHWDWWDCVGTGWVQGIPMCGNVGTWHECSSDGVDCVESSRVMANMLCH